MVTQSFIASDGHKLIYTTAGDPTNPAAIFIHGWTSYKGIWQETLEQLQADYYCIAIDLLGFGESDKPDDSALYLIPAQSARVLDLIDSLGIDRFTLIGHSMGGQISLTIASSLAPERVERLINVAGVVTGRLMPLVERLTMPLIAVRYHFHLMVNPFVTIPMHFAPLAYIIYRPWFHKMNSLPFASWADDRWHALKPSVTQTTHYAGYAIRHHDLRPHLHKITAPTLTIFGCEDLTVPTTEGHLTAAAIPDHRSIWYEACGHFPMYEKKTAFLRDVTAFLCQRLTVAP